MYGHPLIKTAVISAFAWLVWHSEPYGGWLWSIDAWFSAGFRVVPPNLVRPLFLAAVGIILGADVLGAVLPVLKWRVRCQRGGLLLLFLVSVASLWVLRVHRWTGDLGGTEANNYVDTHPPNAVPPIEMAEPLASFSLHYTLQAASALGLKPSQAMQIEVVAYGGTAMIALALWARAISAQPALVFWMIASSGFMVLLCGYPEKGTPRALALNFWYIYTATQALRGAGPGWGIAASTFLSLAALMHGSALCWLPAHALYVWRLAGWRDRAASISAFLIPIAALTLYIRSGAWVVGGPYGNIIAPVAWTADFPPLSWTVYYCERYAPSYCKVPFFTFDHFFNVGSTLLLLAPMAILCLPEATWRSRSPIERWLLIGSLGWLFLSAIWFPTFGFISDWDIFALTPYVVSCWTAYIATAQLPPERVRRFAFSWIALAGTHAISWWYGFRLLTE